MQRYEAQIIGVQPPKGQSGYAHPVFKYEDECGESRTYTRKGGMIITPFSLCRKYIVCRKMKKGKACTYEKEEHRIAPNFWFFVFRCIASFLSFFTPIIGVVTMPMTALYYVGRRFIKVVRAQELHARTEKVAPTKGRLVGYQEKTMELVGGTVHYRYYPIIEYEYEGMVYRHVSRVRQHNIYKKVKLNHNIYVDDWNKMVFDEMEANKQVKLLPEEIKSIRDIAELVPIPAFNSKEKRKKKEEIARENEYINMSSLRFRVIEQPRYG